MKTQEQLDTERRELQAELSNLRGAEDAKRIIAALNANSSESKQLKRVQLLARVNREQARLREIAAQVWECEQPSTDITTNDGSFHAVKVRKFPKLAALENARAKFENGVMTQLNVDGHRFYLVTSKHEYNQPTVYTRHESLTALIAFHSILPEELTIDKYNKLAEDCERINAEFEEQVKMFDAKKNQLNLSLFAHCGLLDNRNAGHVYKYLPNN
jgi:hypothetical protein